MSVNMLTYFTCKKHCFHNCAGPLAGTFLTKASTRTVSITGVVLMSSSLIVFAYLPSYEYMYVVYGAVCGM